MTAAERLNASGKAILPGFVNCHGHAGMILLRESRNRAAIDRLHLERETQWQRIQQELFRKHGGRTDAPDA